MESCTVDSVHSALQFGSGKYTGELLNGEPHGQGKAVYNVNNRETGMTYDGAWRYCLRHGYGIEIYENGNMYEGIFKNG